MHLRLHPAASAELDAAADWYAARAGHLVAVSFVAAYAAAAMLISDNPKIGTPGPADTRKLQFRRFPYAVVYRLHNDHAVVIAIAHQRRRPGFWAKRG